MNPDKTPARISLILSWIIAAMLVLLPFHAFLTVWSSSVLGHYTLLRLWKEFLLAIIATGTIYILVSDKPLRKKLFSLWPARLIGLYALVLLIWGFVALAKNDVTGKAMWYGLLVNLRFFIFFLAVWTIATKSNFLIREWKKILLIPAILVSVFAILQYLVLPYDFLKHFGYGGSTILPYETINHNVNHLRVASTLRGANPLGAYLLLPLTALSILLFKNKAKRREGDILFLGFFAALVFSFSRSAWIGLGLSLLFAAWVLLKRGSARKIFVLILTALVIAGSLGAIVLRHNTAFETTFLHTDHTSKALESSNQGHNAAFKKGISDIYHQPFGGGVGTAGPASIYNDHSGRIAENYFLQIGQEAGILGMALFIAINVMVGRLLWLKRADPLALTLLASLIGLTFVNMLSHAWADDTLSYIWWGLAAVALAPAILKANKHK